MTTKLLSWGPGSGDVAGLYEADRALVARMIAGEARAFDEFFNSHAPRLVAFIARRSGLDDAAVEDVVQNTFIKAMRNLTTYRGEASLFTWLTGIGLNSLVDALRKDQRRPAHVSLEELDQRAAFGFEPGKFWMQDPSRQAETHSQRRAVVAVLNSLPERYAAALSAKYGDGSSVEEISAMLGVTVVAAQSLLARAREAFRDRWLAGERESGKWVGRHE